METAIYLIGRWGHAGKAVNWHVSVCVLGGGGGEEKKRRGERRRRGGGRGGEEEGGGEKKRRGELGGSVSTMTHTYTHSHTHSLTHNSQKIGHHTDRSCDCLN